GEITAVLAPAPQFTLPATEGAQAPEYLPEHSFVVAAAGPVQQLIELMAAHLVFDITRDALKGRGHGKHAAVRVEDHDCVARVIDGGRGGPQAALQATVGRDVLKRARSALQAATRLELAQRADHDHAFLGAPGGCDMMLELGMAHARVADTGERRPDPGAFFFGRSAERRVATGGRPLGAR